MGGEASLRGGYTRRARRAMRRRPHCKEVSMDRRLLSLLTILALGRVGYTAGPEVEYPSGFRQWAHVKSMVIYSDKHPLFGQFGGFHSVYVNPKELPAMTKGGSLPDGTVLLVDLTVARQDDGAF